MNPRKACTPVWWVSEELEKLRRFHSLMEETLVRLQETRAQELQRLGGPGVTDAHIDWLTEEAPRDYDANNLPKKLRYSVLIHLFTTIETHGLTMCHEIAEVVPSRLTPSDLKGAALERIQNYLDKVCGVFPAGRAEWERIHWIEKLRHIVVHDAGCVPAGAKGTFFKQLEKRDIGITIDTNREVYLSRELCSELIDATAAWFDAVYAAAGLSYEPWSDSAASS
ncbi:MAG: hypothetical protein ABL961_12885 [Vicinamibacterales bacterium]